MSGTIEAREKQIKDALYALDQSVTLMMNMAAAVRKAERDMESAKKVYDECCRKVLTAAMGTA